MDLAVSRTSTLSPSAAERPRALTSNHSLGSPSASVASSSTSSRRPSTSVAQRLSVSLQRSPVVAGVTRSFAARLAGSFSTNGSPSAIAKQLQLHDRNVSVSRVSRASVLRVEPTSTKRAQGLTSPSQIPSRAAPSHLTPHLPPQHELNEHSRNPSTDHSHLPISAAASPPPPVRVTIGPDDGPTLPQQPAAVDEPQTASRQRDVSKSLASRVSSVSSVSSRQSEVEQAAERLRSLDQEMMRRKTSVLLHPISKKLTHAQQQQQRQLEQQQQQAVAPDERQRGQTINTPPTYTIALDSSPPINSSHTITTTVSPPAHHSTLSPASLSTTSDPAAETAAADGEAAAVPPATGCGAVVAATISSIIFSVVYLPFTVAILTQSVVQQRPILPVNWQQELTGNYWIFSFSLFGFLFCFPFILVFGLLADTGIWSIFNNNVRSAIPFTMFFALYLSLFVMLHVATWYYALLRKDLSVIHSKTRQYHVNVSTLLCTAAIIFEAFQLISPFTSITTLGLHTASSTASDSGVEQKYHGWLTSMGHVFGVGEWQVQDINTFLETFWIAFSIIIFYAFALGYGIQSNMQPSHMVAPVLFELIPGTFYLSIVGRLFRIFDCAPAGDGTYTLNGNSSIECWNNFTHRSMCMAAFMGLLFYSSSAMFVACYRGDASGGQGVKFKPVYLVLERTLRDLFAMTTSLIGNQILSRAMSFPILLVLTFATYRMQPCSLPTLTRLKVLAQSSAVWLLSLSFLADMFRGVTDWFDVYVPGLLVWGWATGVGMFLLYEAWCYYKRWQRRQQRRHTIAMLGAAAAQGMLLADDDDDSEVEVAIQLGTRDSVHESKDKSKEAHILVEAAAKLSDKKTELHQPATVAITIDSAATSPSPPTQTARVDTVSAFTAPVCTTPSSLIRPLNIKQQAIRHTQAAVLTSDGRRDSVSAQPNVVGRGSMSAAVSL